jgi:hypothetical protein
MSGTNSMRYFIRCLNSSPRLACTSTNLPNYLKEDTIKNSVEVIKYEDKMAKKHILGIQCEELLYYKAIKEEIKNGKYGFKFKV